MAGAKKAAGGKNKTSPTGLVAKTQKNKASRKASPPPAQDVMKVWIDHDLCIGSGLCVEVAPEVFVLVDGLAHVKEGDRVFAASLGNPEGPDGLAIVPRDKHDTIIGAAEECPSECIFIEVE